VCVCVCVCVCVSVCVCGACEEGSRSRVSSPLLDSPQPPSMALPLCSKEPTRRRVSRGVHLPSSASGSELSDCSASAQGGGAAAAQRPSFKAALAADHRSGTGRAEDTTSQTLSVSRTLEGA